MTGFSTTKFDFLSCDSGLLFWATLYILRYRLYSVTSVKPSLRNDLSERTQRPIMTSRHTGWPI